MTRTTVAVCALTHGRPDGLERLLQGLTSQRRPDRTSFDVLIVDNNVDGSASEVCRQWQSRWDGAIRYVHEPVQGIARARNAALDAALDRYDWIAFVDDDEVPENDWLETLLDTQRTYDADIVTGPVEPRFEETPPSWILQGKFFDAVHRPTGSRLDRAYTHNVLFRASIVRGTGIRFDERLGAVGEDQLFFETLCRRGHGIVWADDAVVHEWIPAERASERWLLERKRRIGAAFSFIRQVQSGGPAMAGWLAARGAMRIARGAAAWFPGLFLGHHRRILARCRIAYGWGMLRGLMGRKGLSSETVS